MALVHADNFSVYGTDGNILLNGVYAERDTSVNPSNDPDNLSPGRVLKMDVSYSGGGAYGKLRYVLPATATTCGQACRVWLASLPQNGSVVPAPITFKNASNGAIYSLCILSTGRLSLRLGDFGGTEVAQTAAPAITSQGWYHIEMKMVVSATVGTLEVRVEGITVINLTNQNTGTLPVAQVEFANRADVFGTGVIMYIKDYVVWDGLGTANNNFFGSVLVTNLAPTSDISLNWTPSSGTTAYNILAAVPPVDTTYISGSTSNIGTPNITDIADLPADVTSVKGIITYVRAAKADGGDGSLQVGVISDPLSSPVTGLGANRPITVAQTYWRDIFEVDPKTTAAWLPAAVNKVRLRIDRTV